MNLNNVKILLSGCLLLLSCSLSAQLQEIYESDNLPKTGERITSSAKTEDGIVFSASRAIDSLSNYVITKVDSSGALRWTYTISDGGGICVLKVGEDNMVYAVYSNFSTGCKIIKLDASTGQSIWITNTLLIGGPLDLEFLNYSEIVILGIVNNWSRRYIIADRATGQITSSRLTSTFIEDLACDTNTARIFTYYNDSVYCIDGSNLNNTIWAIEIQQLPSVFGKKIDYWQAHNQLYFLGENSFAPDLPVVARINPSNGVLIFWYASPLLGNVSYVKHTYTQNSLTIAWRYSGTNSNPEFIATKIDTSGTVIWEVRNTVLPLFPNQPTGTGILDFDVDANENVYATGYTGSFNFAPANFVIMKMNGATGSINYTKYILIDSTLNNFASTGYLAAAFDQKILYLGFIQISQEGVNSFYHGWHRSIYYVRTDLSGNTIQRDFLSGYGQSPSSTIAINKLSSGETVVLKQVDVYGKLELYDYAMNLIWEREIHQLPNLWVHSLSVSTSGVIRVNAYNGASEVYVNNPFTRVRTDTLYSYHYSLSGNLIDQHKFVNNNSSINTVIGFLNDSTRTLALMTDFVDIFCMKFDSSSQSQPIQLPFLYLDPVGGNSFGANFSNFSPDTALFVFSLQNYGVQRYYLFKNTMIFQSLNTGPLSLPTLASVKYVSQVSETEVYAAGKSFSAPELVKFSPRQQTVYWAASSAASQSAVHFVKEDIQRNYVYSFIQKNDSSKVYIEKRNILNGSLVWSTPYSSPGNKKIVARAIEFDPCRNLICMGLNEQDSSTSSVFYHPLFLWMDSLGNITDSLRIYGDISDFSHVNVLTQVNNGSLWAGGRIFKSGYGKASYIFKLESDLPVPNINLSGQVNICAGDSVQLFTTSSGPWLWSSGDTSQAIYVSQPGVYSVSTQAGCPYVYSSSAVIAYIQDTIPIVSLNQNILTLNVQQATHQWYFNSTPIPNATQSTYIPQLNGDYSCELTYPSGCVIMSTPLTVTNVGISLTGASDAGIVIFPNPASSFSQIEIKNSSPAYENLTFELLSADGALQMTNSLDGGTNIIWLENFPEGMYIIRIYNESVSVVQRLIIVKSR